MTALVKIQYAKYKHVAKVGVFRIYITTTEEMSRKWNEDSPRDLSI